MKRLRLCIFIIIFLFANVYCLNALSFFNIHRYGDFPKMLAMRSENLLNNATFYFNKVQELTNTDNLYRNVRSTDDVKIDDDNIVQDKQELDSKTNSNSKSSDLKVIPIANSKDFFVDKDKKQDNNKMRRLLFGRTEDNNNMEPKQNQETNDDDIQEIPLNNIDNNRSHRLILLKIQPSGRRYLKRIIYVTGKNNLKPGNLERDEESPERVSKIHTIKIDHLNNVGAGNTFADLKGLLDESQDNPTKYIKKLNNYDYPRLIEIITKTTGGKNVNPSLSFKHATTTSPPTINEEQDYETIIKSLKEYKQEAILQNNRPKEEIKYDNEVFLQDWSTYKENLKNDDMLGLLAYIDKTRKNVNSVNGEKTVNDSTENENVDLHVAPFINENPDTSYTKEIQIKVHSLGNPDNRQKSDNLPIPSLTVLPMVSNKIALETNQQTQNVFMEYLKNNTTTNDQYKDTTDQSSLVTNMDNKSKTYKGDNNMENANALIKLPEDLIITITKKLCIQVHDKLLKAWDLIIQTTGLNTEGSKDNDEKRQNDVRDIFIDIAMQRDFNELPLQTILDKFLIKFSTKHPEDREKHSFRANYFNLPLMKLNPERKVTSFQSFDAQSPQIYDDNDFKNKLLKFYHKVNVVHGENVPSKSENPYISQKRAIISDMSIALANLLKQMLNNPYTLPEEIVPSLISYLMSNFNISAPRNYCELKKYSKLVEGFKQLLEDYYSNKHCANLATVANSDKIMLGHELPTFDSQELI